MRFTDTSPYGRVTYRVATVYPGGVSTESNPVSTAILHPDDRVRVVSTGKLGYVDNIVIRQGTYAIILLDGATAPVAVPLADVAVI